MAHRSRVLVRRCSIHILPVQRALGEDERLLRKAALRPLGIEDATENMAAVAERWLAARAKRAGTLREIEGQQTFDRQQRFLDVAARLARERRLSRFVYLAEKPR